MRHSLSLLALLLVFPGLARTQDVVRVNQLGYLPDAVKVAVLMSKDTAVGPFSWELRDALTNEQVWRSSSASLDNPSGKYRSLRRLDFSGWTVPGAYYVQARGVRSPSFRIDADVYDGTADFLLNYMRQQRCGFNPFLNDSCHTHDGYIIYHPTRDSTFIDVVGGWHDASDYLQYVTTSATAAAQMLFAYERHPSSFGDAYQANGRPGPNGIPDILDEAKWGLDWLVKMNPGPKTMFNQIADDRDHMGFKLPTHDSISYGKGLERPVYFCTGKPQGVMKYRNRTTGIASTAAKFATAFAMGSTLLERFYPEFAATVRTKAFDAYAWGKSNPGVCQTAPCRAPYFYEEDNWVDDMELAAAQLFRVSGDSLYLRDALLFGAMQPVVPWMGADSARHYQWYPFVNLGHAALAAELGAHGSAQPVEWMKEGVERVKREGETRPFRFGVPFIWCSNNLVSGMLTHMHLYAEASGDRSFDGMEAGLRDWLFGCNPWGTSMIVGLPKNGTSPKDPHSAFTHVAGYPIDGGLVDGPVRASIFNSLKGVQLSKEDPFKEFQSASAVYHDDWADYSSNEPTMDGTAGLTIYLSALQQQGVRSAWLPQAVRDRGAVVRLDTTQKVIALVFTGHEFSDGGKTIASTLKKHGVKASFFFTGDFYRSKEKAPLIRRLLSDGHYLGAHSDAHLLYASWERRDSTLVSQRQFLEDLAGNYKAMRTFGIRKQDAPVFLPPFEWYNAEVAGWCRDAGVRLVNFTPGTRSNADYTVPGSDKNYVGSAEIENTILAYESSRPAGLNGFILLSHIGTDPRRTDKFYNRLDRIITELKQRGYRFTSFKDLK